jgi:hypothetical protein
MVLRAKLKMAILKEIFNKTSQGRQPGMETSVTRFDINYNDMEKAVGEPHKTEKIKGNLTTEADWYFSFLGIPFIIFYDSREWYIKKLSANKKLEKQNLESIENVGEGRIVGKIDFVGNVILKLIHFAIGKKEVSSTDKRDIVRKVL